jgi:transposase
MLAISSGARIFICREPTDMRKSYNGLIYTVQNHFKQNPLHGGFFVFTNKNRNRMKVLFWDTGGFCLFCKRLEKGRFRFPSGSENEISKIDFSLIIEGINIDSVKRLPRYNP